MDGDFEPYFKEKLEQEVEKNNEININNHNEIVDHIRSKGIDVVFNEDGMNISFDFRGIYVINIWSNISRCRIGIVIDEFEKVFYFNERSRIDVVKKFIDEILNLSEPIEIFKWKKDIERINNQRVIYESDKGKLMELENNIREFYNNMPKQKFLMYFKAFGDTVKL